MPAKRDTLILRRSNKSRFSTIRASLCPASHFAEVSLGEGPMEIRRIDGLRGAEISANYKALTLVVSIR